MRKKNYVVTIGREKGSYGHEIGKMLAERLGISFYDSELIQEAAKKSGVDEDTLKKIDESKDTSLFFSIAMNIFPYPSKMEKLDGLSLGDKLFMVQKEILKKYASEGPCVIVGRCSNYVLKKEFNCINIFVYSSFQKRVQAMMELNKVSYEEAEEYVKRADKKRANYYNYYTGMIWGKAEGYDLLLDSGQLDLQQCVTLLEHYVSLRMEK